jgi:hypothetical protein
MGSICCSNKDDFHSTGLKQGKNKGKKPNIRSSMETHYIPFEITKNEKPDKSLKIISLNILAQHLADKEFPGY